MPKYDFWAKACNDFMYSLAEDDGTDMIYHYTSLSGFKGIIENHELWFTNRFYLNDTTEGYYILSLYNRKLEEILSGTDLYGIKDFVRNKTLEYIKGFESIPSCVYQTSFSLDQDKLCMWNYYTKNSDNEGLSLGFCVNELYDSIQKEKYEYEKRIKDGNENDKGKAFPTLYRGKVVYKEEEQVKRIKELVITIYEALLKDEQNNKELAQQSFLNYSFFFYHRLILLGTFFKSSVFEEEREYRLAFDFFAAEDQITKKYGTKILFRQGNGILIPYTKATFDSKALKSVVYSPTINKDRFNSSIKLFLDNQGFSQVEIKASKIPVRF